MPGFTSLNGISSWGGVAGRPGDAAGKVGATAVGLGVAANCARMGAAPIKAAIATLKIMWGKRRIAEDERIKKYNPAVRKTPVLYALK
jgi:hypothetical protein